jgi:chorismate-pyruvate lyase
MTVRRATPELNALLDLFYEDSADLGAFYEVSEAELTPEARKLLAHDQHMTVTVEDFHRCSVAVEVIQTHITPTHYARKIRLRRSTDGGIVLLGFVRLGLAALSPEVRAEIESQRTPLGNVLIKHNVLRTVRLLSLWRVTPADEMCTLMALPEPKDCFGRTALIYCDRVPAVELLEIIAPV